MQNFWDRKLSRAYTFRYCFKYVNKPFSKAATESIEKHAPKLFLDAVKTSLSFLRLHSNRRLLPGRYVFKECTTCFTKKWLVSRSPQVLYFMCYKYVSHACLSYCQCMLLICHRFLFICITEVKCSNQKATLLSTAVKKRFDVPIQSSIFFNWISFHVYFPCFMFALFADSSYATCPVQGNCFNFPTTGNGTDLTLSHTAPWPWLNF